MRTFALASAFALGVGAARIQIDTLAEDLTAEAVPLHSPQFPNTVIIRNAKMQWSESEGEEEHQLLFAEDRANVMERVGAAPDVVDQSKAWVIEQHQGTSAFTICNPHNCRCLFATDQRTVGASDLGFQDDQLWMIEPTGSDPQLHTITHMTSGLRLYRGGMSGDEFGVGDDAFGHSERVWPDQTWFIEDQTAASSLAEGDFNFAANVELTETVAEPEELTNSERLVRDFPCPYGRRVRLLRGSRSSQCAMVLITRVRRNQYHMDCRIQYDDGQIDEVHSIDLYEDNRCPQQEIARCQRPPPVFPNPVLLSNADSEKLLEAGTRPERFGARTAPTHTHPALDTVGPTYSWAIEQYQGSRFSTICNQYSGRCLYVPESGVSQEAAVEATGPTGSDGDGGVSASQLWLIEPRDDGTYTVTHRNSHLRLFASANGNWGVGDGGRVWPDQTWYIEDRDLKCTGAGAWSGDYLTNRADGWTVDKPQGDPFAFDCIGWRYVRGRRRCSVHCLDIERCLRDGLPCE